jgi:pyruvate dehydrogenase E2 component (dihydrolipoamide acetyltransferase)
MAVAVLLPKLGLTMTEGTISEWLVQPGDTVGVGDPLLSLATDKVDVEVEAEGAGIFHPSVEAGSVLPPGAVVGWLLEEGEQPPEDAGTSELVSEAEDAVVSDPVAAAAPITSPNGSRLKASPNARRIATELGVDLASIRGSGPGGRIVSEDVEEQAAGASASGTAERTGSDATVRVTPLVRKLAAELGVDLAEVRPSGPDGKLTRSDVQRAAAQLSEPLPVALAPVAAAVVRTAAPTSQPMTAMRNAIARNMVASLQEMAQLTLGHDADVTALVATRAALKAENADTGRRTPTITDFVVKAAALALVEHPRMNSALREGRIESSDRIDVGVAVAIEDGLLVPVVRDADRRSVGDISADAARLAAAGRAGKLSLAELEGATFVVSSLGTAGIDFFTPIINPGTSGILGVGRIRDGVRWDGETPKRTDVMTLSLTFDHRVIDGAPAAAYLLTVANLLSRPLSLLTG